MMIVMMNMKQMKKLLWKATQPLWMKTIVVSTSTSYSKKFCKVRIRAFLCLEKETLNLKIPVFVFVFVAVAVSVFILAHCLILL
jgi:hypothetical protein